MFNALTALALGIVVFAITIGVGVVVLGKFAGAVADCPTGYVWNTNGTTIFGDDACCLTGGTDCTSAGNFTVGDTSATTVASLATEMGTTGLAGWASAIIALAVGLLFIGALVGRGRKY